MFSTLPITSVYTSSLRRASSTARCIAAQRSAVVKQHTESSGGDGDGDGDGNGNVGVWYEERDDLLEFSFGECDGELCTPESAAGRTALRVLALWEKGDTLSHTPEGESPRVALQRAIPAIDACLTAHNKRGMGECVFVAHGRILRHSIAFVAGKEISEIKLDNSSVWAITFMLIY